MIKHHFRLLFILRNQSLIDLLLDHQTIDSFISHEIEENENILSRVF